MTNVVVDFHILLEQKNNKSIFFVGIFIALPEIRRRQELCIICSIERTIRFRLTYIITRGMARGGMCATCES